MRGTEPELIKHDRGKPRGSGGHAREHAPCRLLYAAFAAHPDYEARAVPRTILRWRLAGTATTETARLVDWFCANHSAQALQIERDLRLKMRKLGWRV
jgi:hypothetical protein